LRIVSNANPTGGIKAPDNAAFGVQPQGWARQIDWRQRPMAATAPENAFTMAVSWPSARVPRGASRNRGHIAS
jgi:hypothetical protein